jgi:deoxycytidylate deaminase
MDIAPPPCGNFYQTHKYYRIVYEMVKNHPDTKALCALHGSVLVRGGKILSIGLNDPGRSAFSDSYATHACFTRHAELNAIRSVRKKIDLTGAVCYNIRVDKWGKVRLSAPCKGCQQLLIDYGIKKCYFSVSDTEMGCWKILDLKRVA